MSKYNDEPYVSPRPRWLDIVIAVLVPILGIVIGLLLRWHNGGPIELK